MKTSYERLVLASKNKTPSEIAEALDTTSANVGNWLTRGVSKTGAMKAAEVFGVTMDWILTGKGNMPPEVVKPSDSNVSYMRKIIMYNSLDELPDGEFVLIPQIDIRLSAGSGRENPHVDEKNALPFMTDFVRRLGIKPKNAITMKVEGRSMEPMLWDGDTVIIDQGDNAPTSQGGVYAIVMGDDWMVKRVTKNPAGGVLIESDNKAAGKDWDLSEEKAELAGIQIVGRVKYRSGMGGDF